MSTQSKSELTLEKYLPYRLSILSNLVSGMIARAYEDKFALSISEWRIIAVLGEYPRSSADDISKTTRTEKSIISRALQRLLKRRLIKREVSVTDRRRQHLTLTKNGMDIYQQVVPLSYEYEQKLLECFSEREQASFDKLVEKLYRHAEEIS